MKIVIIGNKALTPSPIDMNDTYGLRRYNCLSDCQSWFLRELFCTFTWWRTRLGCPVASDYDDDFALRNSMKNGKAIDDMIWVIMMNLFMTVKAT